MEINHNLSEATVSTLKASVDFLVDNGTVITQLFYQKLFRAHPKLKNSFNSTQQHNGEQAEALAKAVYSFADNVDKLDEFTEQISRISHKHCSINIRPEDYPIVGEHLLAAIHEIIKTKLDTATADLITSAWQKGYSILSSLLIKKEQALYDESENKHNGWLGMREFTVFKRVTESIDTISFYIKPINDYPLPKFHPGQYISVFVKPENSEFQQIRQYSLSNSFNEKFYQITVKRHGVISNYIHDNWLVGQSIYITPPVGDFILRENNNKPIILLSAGIGVTPNIAVLKTLLDTRKNQNITFIHAVKNSKHQPFKHYINQTSKTHETRFKKFIFYESPLDSDVLYKDFDYSGLIDLKEIQLKIDSDNSDYYLCGPIAFMSLVHKTITSWGVNNKNIHYEIFGASKKLY